jgi:hypothetical protein
MSAEDWLHARMAAGNGPVEAARIPWRSRVLLLAGVSPLRPRDVAGAYLLCRWSAQQSRVQVDGDRVSVSSGFTGVTAFTKRGVLRKAATP